ncbi:hypothetical protein ACFXKR_13195 [Streptomyces violascens]
MPEQGPGTLRGTWPSEADDELSSWLPWTTGLLLEGGAALKYAARHRSS